MKLEDLCGEHYLCGVEMGVEDADHGLGPVHSNVILFSIDGVTYKLTEDPADGYRSFCSELEMSDKPPRFSFQPVKVFCHMMEDDDGRENDCIVIRDAKNSKIILEAGTTNCGDWYPCCHFSYTPENMACNQLKDG